MEPARVATPGQERRYLMQNLAPPPNWKIWIANLGFDGAPAWVFNGVPVTTLKYVPSVSYGGMPRPNLQTTAFVVGKMFIYGFSSPFAEINGMWIFSEDAEATLLPRIWPAPGRDISWPPSLSLPRDAAIIISTRLAEFIDRRQQAWL